MHSKICSVPRVSIETLENRTLLVGWTPLVRTAPAGLGTMMLLSDGTVMAQRAGATNTWYRLKPDAAGSYVNGTWSTLALMNLQRLYFASNVLPDGRVFLLGGEYTGPSGTLNRTNTGEMYDPVANVWTNILHHPEANYGDVPSAVMPDGRILAGSLTTASTYIYDPATNLWSSGPTKLASDRSDEETWAMLPDHSVLSYNVFGTNPTGSQRWDPTTNTWINSGQVPVQLHTSSGHELGPALRLPDGRYLWVGATNHNAIYTPSATPGGTGSWVAAPDTPGNIGANDATGAILPNGHVIYAAGDQSTSFNPPTSLFDFDPIANTITPLSTVGGPNLASVRPFSTRMLMLPTGQILYATGSNLAYAYTGDGAPDPSWAPTVSNITANGGGVFTLTGTQLNGISEGASYGDDAQMSSNYPIIRLTDQNGVVSFARTFNWSSTAVATGSLPVTTQFTLPAGLQPGAYKLAVIANGIASREVLAVMLGGGLGTDATLRLDPNNASNVAVYHLGSSFASFPLSSVSAAFIIGDNQADTMEVDDDLAALPVTVNGGGGLDQLTIRSNLPDGATWTIDASHVTSAGRLNVTYASDVGRILLFASAGTDTIDVTETSPLVPITIEPSTGSDIVNINTDNTGTANVTFGGTQRLSTLTIGDGGSASVITGLGNQVLIVSDISISGLGLLDLNDNDLIVDYLSTSPIAQVQALINNARAGGAWTGNGITSTTARNASPKNTSLGAIESSDFLALYGAGAPFSGEAIDKSAVLVKYTYYGDTDFNGVVDFDDYSRTDQGFNTFKSGWFNGDFDGNGVIDFDDYSLIDLAFNTQVGALRPSRMPTLPKPAKLRR